ncbi:MAG: polyhydroxyalkanoate synthesis repressor PhaR [Sphingomonadales bacterium]|nr:polyhydroxyalkanoate synthesis repressor PhaR [Sphingomonadales bacterium]PIX64913.1 MAG: polyhydroxyalkanoate synthesis repressor PhaR [Sphingomonadales bacterium CG_4_10_14_3_um_filter_58_15]NCO48546.1 polyhydroxyalkanoate synthesis repressor PhaR [Sphingomonadales bacterium]NCO99866.1 polyhydroxyalkanoate synthesis repressor PhaR [Sphingomonadales bacterium]NCP25753.1 polyhydroxyalkanoate synthesis repressor PhaR [Sphingomonadales bacterium]
MAKSKTTNPGDPIVIKKYANRRLYNTQSSRYITLDFLAEMTRNDQDFVVVDAKTGEDITHNVLTQIIVDEESSGKQMLPVKFLRQLISMYGNSMQSLMPSYLEASMDNFRKNQKQFQEAVEGALNKNPLGQMAVKNQKQFQEAVENALKASPLAGVFEKALSLGHNGSADNDDSSQDTASEKDAEIMALKKQLADIQSKIDKLDS